MKKNHLLLVAIALITLASCKSKGAYNFSQSIVSKEKSLEPFIKPTEDAIGKYFQAKQYDSITAASVKMEVKIDKALSEIKAMDADGYKEGKQFKNASVNYFEFMKSVYTTYKEIGMASSDETRQSKLDELMKIVDAKDKVVDEMQSSQKKFAEANGFKLEPARYSPSKS